MAAITSNGAATEARPSVGQVLKSYFYWTYPRGSFHYDVMVTLILAFLFITPHLWDYGAKPSPATGSAHAFLVEPSGVGVIITVEAADVAIAAGATEGQVKQALRTAIEPVMGDAVYVEKWETVRDAQGNLAWKVWAHR